MLRSLILSASSSCFVACPGCYNYFEDPLATTAQIIEFVEALRDHTGLTKVTVGGGDPLARADIYVLLVALKEMNLNVYLDTVGTPLLGDARIRFQGSGNVAAVSPEKVSSTCDLIGIPLDGATDEVATQFRIGVSVASQLEILERLDRVGADLCVNTVVHKGNLDDLPSIYKLIAPIGGISRWQLFQYMPIGPMGYRNRRKFEISEADFHAAIESVRQVAASGPILLEPKSRASRKQRYLLMDANGTLWTPAQEGRADWMAQDANPDRQVVGQISDADIIARVDLVFGRSAKRV